MSSNTDIEELREEIDTLIIRACAYDWKENGKYFIAGGTNCTKRIIKAKNKLIRHVQAQLNHNKKGDNDVKRTI